jgi:hypothetical protein
LVKQLCAAKASNDQVEQMRLRTHWNRLNALWDEYTVLGRFPTEFRTEEVAQFHVHLAELLYS